MVRSNLPPRAQKLLDYLKSQSVSPGKVYIEREAMAEGTAQSRRTVVSALKDLERQGYISARGRGWIDLHTKALDNTIEKAGAFLNFEGRAPAAYIAPKLEPGADLRGINLRNANLRGVDLHDTNLEGADMEGADLRRANLSRANLRETNLTKTRWQKAFAAHADFTGANLAEADITDGVFSRVQFAHCHVQGCRVGNPLNPVEEFQGSTFTGTDTIQFAGMANNHTLVGWITLRNFGHSAIGRLIGARLMAIDEALSCWQAALIDIGTTTPSFFIEWHDFWDATQDRLDPNLYAQIKLELHVLACRLRRGDPDDLFQRWSHIDGISPRMRFYLKSNYRKHLEEGLYAMGLTKEKLSQAAGDIKEANWKRNRLHEQGRDSLPNLSNEEEKNLSQSLSSVHLPDEREMAQLFQRVS